jgi:transglutaminase-like putative cysteine protease
MLHQEKIILKVNRQTNNHNQMKKIIMLLLAAVSLTSFAADDRHFLKDPSLRDRVHQQFEKRKKEAAGRQEVLFSVFKKEKLSPERREALEFLIAYMPLCDLADYDGAFFLEQVDIALKARDYFPWGKTVPDDIFRHFVLPYRVNNENLDSARTVCFHELKDRIRHLSPADAVLEVNHWCHEKASYRGTDMRTSAPLALIRTSWGRCGEESTLATVALRAVGIPARQCYTPRWAHTESNHAWVEAWVDGKWHFIGACEPEAELDVAWFTAPARRAMMVHTNVFGPYDGPEEKNNVSTLFTRINLLEHYADTRRVNVRVVDENDRPVQGATVKCNVFNGGSLSPVYTNTTDEKGEVSLVSGKGDLFVWANKHERFGYKKATPRDENNTIRLNLAPGTPIREDFTMNVPPEQPVPQHSSPRAAANAICSARDDSIRNAYMKTFITEDAARELAREHRLDPDNVWKYLNDAQGNWHDIRDFILSEKNNPDLFPFLSVLTAKDLRDTPLSCLQDHLQNRESLKIQEGTPDELIVPYILSPRIENELITPWRSYLQKNLRREMQSAARTGADAIVDLINRRVKINEEDNYCECPISPKGVYELGMADKRSRNILFVALARTFGIPARAAAGNPQYFDGGEWQTAFFAGDNPAPSAGKPKGQLIILHESKDDSRPNYSLTAFADGDFRFRGFGGNRGRNRNPSNPATLDVDTGYYRILSGIRDSDGSARISAQYFEIRENETLNLTVKTPEIVTRIDVKGNLDMNSPVNTGRPTAATLKALSKGKGLAICFLDPGKEPSKHILQDFPSVQHEIEQWGGGVLFIIPDDKTSEAFTASAFGGLPGQAVWAIDPKRVLLHTITKMLQFDLGDNFPLTLYLSDNGDILYYSAGYKIGTGRDILKIIREEEQRP